MTQKFTQNRKTLVNEISRGIWRCLKHERDIGRKAMLNDAKTAFTFTPDQSQNCPIDDVTTFNSVQTKSETDKKCVLRQHVTVFFVGKQARRRSGLADNMTDNIRILFQLGLS